MGTFGKIVFGIWCILNTTVNSLCRDNNPLTELWTKDNGECLQDPNEPGRLPVNCGGGKNFVYANVNELPSNVPQDYQCHSDDWVSAHVMHHSTGCNGTYGQTQVFMHNLQSNFFSSSKALNAEMTKCENRLVEWLREDNHCGRIDATNFVVGDCGNNNDDPHTPVDHTKPIFPHGHTDANNCGTPDYLMCGMGEIKYYKGTLEKDADNHVTCNIDLGNSCTINIHGGDDYEEVVMTGDYQNHDVIRI